MLLNADFSRRVIVTPRDYRWVKSPQPGVDRMMLDRIGDEVARATTIVRYAPDSRFPQHTHAAGEEILVLSGVFSEGEDHYGKGWYLRSPPGSSHQPFTREGATIFVKLRQMPPSEDRRVRLDSNAPAAWHPAGDRSVCPLFDSSYEQVRLERLPPGAVVLRGSIEGAEILVLAGSVIIAADTCPEGSWLRLPPTSDAGVVAGASGATVYIKTGRFPASDRNGGMPQPSTAA